VLELGAGIGLCGNVAAVVGAKELLITDYQADCLEAAQQNAASNNVSERVSAAILDWSHYKLEEEAGVAWARCTAEAGKEGWVPDMIIAADVCYSGEHAVMMLQVVVHIWRQVNPLCDVWIVNGFPNRGLRRFEAVIGAAEAFPNSIAISRDDPNTSHFAKWHDAEDIEEAMNHAEVDALAASQQDIRLLETQEVVGVTGEGVRQRAYRLAFAGSGA